MLQACLINLNLEESLLFYGIPIPFTYVTLTIYTACEYPRIRVSLSLVVVFD